MKENRKVQYSKMVLKEALLDLLQTKRISEISIRELCVKADLNRSTFYAHYSDIYDLFEEAENDFLEKIPIFPDADDLQQSMYQYIAFCSDHFDLIRLFVTEGHITEKINKKSMEIWNQSEMHSPKEIEIFHFLSIFFSYGFFHSLMDWLSSGQNISPEELSVIATRLFNDITKFRLELTEGGAFD